MLLFRLLRDARVSTANKALVGMGLAYYILPIDILPEAIVGPMLPHMRDLRGQGVATIVDCTPTDLGQHMAAYRAVAERTGLRVVAAVGTYRDGWLPG